MRSFDIAAALGREGIEYERRADGDNLRIRCPFHDDETPSCDVSQSKQQYICRACDAKGGVVALLVRLLNKPRHLILAGLQQSTDRPVEAAAVVRYHDKIWSATSLLSELYKRGVSDDTIRKYLLGEHQGRITIPIANETGMFVNLRQYLPGASEFKTTNLRGRGSDRLYPFNQLAYDDILLTGGEIKALAGLQRLNEHGIGCVTLTSGETQWSDKFDEYFRDKKVWIGLDIDAAGKFAAEFRCKRLSTIASWVGRVDWPLDPIKHPRGDLNDYVMQEGADLHQLLLDTPQWALPTIPTPGEAEAVLETPIESTVRGAYSASMVDRRFLTTALIIANGQDSYFLPKEVMPICDQRQENCAKCPMFGTEVGRTFKIHAENDILLSMMDAPTATVTDSISKALSVPACPIVEYKIKEKFEVREYRVQQAIDLNKQDLENETIPTMMIGVDADLNETYKLVGKTVSHPKTQKGVAIVSSAEKVADALKGFQLSNPEELMRFRPSSWTPGDIDFLLDGIYNELSRNVTMIYERKNVHATVDLSYHSVLHLPIGNNIQKGWVEVLIIGDSSQGKSFTACRMADFYGLGEKVDCKNATVAGLVGGLEQIAGKWFVQWGVLPRHDRRLVILEELKGMHSDVFSKLTEVRSSGRAELPKIIRRFAPARTRLVVLSNPRSSQVMSAYSYGVNAIKELIKNPEDIRRFDLSMVVTREDVASAVVNQTREPVEETFTSDMSRRLILWCWTRSAEQTILLPDTVSAAVDFANKLSEKYVDDIPLLERAGSKYKILRLAAALAGRTFSASDDFESLIVRPCHVEWVSHFLDTEYSRAANGYSTFSASIKRKHDIQDPDVLRAAIAALPHAEVVMDRLLSTDEIAHQDLADWIGWTRDEVDILVSKLVRCNAFKRDDRIYRKTPPFIELLRTVKLGRPEHIPTTESPHAY